MARRAVVPAVLLVVAMVGVPLAGVALAYATSPVIPAEPVAPLDPAAAFPAMPTPPSTVRPLTDSFERLPLVEAGSEADRPFVTRYRDLAIGDLPSATALIDVAFDEIRVAPSSRAVTRELLDALIRPAAGTEEPDPDLGGDTTVPTGMFDTPVFRALSGRAMTAIAATPSNARAMNDLAVAIATAWVSDPHVLPVGPDPNATIAFAPQLREAAIELLELGLASFPGDRALTINLADLRSLETETDDVGVQFFSEGLAPAVARLHSYVDGEPTDSTAASLLANLLVLTDREHGLDRATTITQPFLDSADSEAAGRIIRADSLLFAADRDRTQRPFLARSEERRALDDYDRVIELTGDAAAFAGRARALDVLGSRAAALEAQREAVRLAPSSLPWRLRVAQLERCTVQVDAWRRDAGEALVAAKTIKAPPILQARNVLLDGPGLDFGRHSIGSDLPAWDVTIRIPATGVTISAIDPFPEPEACISGEPTLASAVEDATLEVALAAIAADDLAAARAALEPWHFDPTDEGDGGGEIATGDQAGVAATVMGLLAGEPLVEDDDSIRLFLPLASRLPPAAEARICRMLAGVAGLTTADADALTVCAAEAADRTGDHEAAVRAIEPAVRLDDRTDPTNGSTALKAGMLSELTGDLGAARTRYEVAAAYADTSIGGLVRLGDLDLRENDASGALAHYALAAAAIRTQGAAADGVEMDDALAGRLGQYVDNNRGIALLMTARSETDTPPDCATYAAICRRAGDAFAAAVAADQMNPVYPLNAAWVARLTGDADGATTLLTKALEEGIPLVAAAHNDLGVLAAQRGEFGDARAHFVQAIATDPEYDLATWNLGVLESRQAAALVVAGQGLLARAIELDSDLLTKPLAFLTDERVYRVDVSGTQLELARAPGTGAAVGAAAFGAIATVGALAQLISGLGGDVQDAAETVATEGLGRAGRRLRGLRGRLRVADRGWPTWVAWLPAIVVLTVTTAWTAAWMAPDAVFTALVIGLAAAGLALAVHTCGHLVVAGRFGASFQASGWSPGIALAVVGMPFHVPAGPFLAEYITTGDPRRDWWVSFAGVLTNLAAAGIALLIYLAAPMPFLRILIATQLAVAAFSLIPSHPLDGSRLAARPIVLAVLSLGVAAASTAIAVGAI